MVFINDPRAATSVPNRCTHKHFDYQCKEAVCRNKNGTWSVQCQYHKDMNNDNHRRRYHRKNTIIDSDDEDDEDEDPKKDLRNFFAKKDETTTIIEENSKDEDNNSKEDEETQTETHEDSKEEPFQKQIKDMRKRLQEQPHGPMPSSLHEGIEQYRYDSLRCELSSRSLAP